MQPKVMPTDYRLIDREFSMISSQNYEEDCRFRYIKITLKALKNDNDFFQAETSSFNKISF